MVNSQLLLAALTFTISVFTSHVEVDISPSPRAWVGSPWILADVLAKETWSGNEDEEERRFYMAESGYRKVNHICKDLFPNKETFTGSKNWDVDVIFEGPLTSLLWVSQSWKKLDD